VRRPYPSVAGWDDGADRASHDADVSIIPPKIPYGGFSPVRLQGWHVSTSLPASGVHVSRPPGLHRPFVLTAFSVSFSALCRSSCAPKHRHASGYTALPQGPALRSGLCCRGPSSLMRPHPPHSQAQHDFTALQLIRAVFAVRFRLGDPRLVPLSPRILSQHVALYDSGESSDCIHPVPSPPTLGFVPLAQTRHSQYPHKSVSRGISKLPYGSLSLTTCCFVHPPDGSDRICTQPARISTTGLSTVWSPAPSPVIATVATG
jgi:hypothetical protein